jgi:hypothetical protein
MRIPVPSADLHQGVSERARSSVSGTTAAVSGSCDDEDIGVDPWMEGRDMCRVEVEGGFRKYKRHGSIVDV